ncbi:hypothetical protein [Streptomyces alanosinicus]|uniref:hypothetical protein n=1 Tax=Streptomyces alanosinicus TaxID=68171 RepID=UPI0016731ED7|nr:hypothetical protein [Streptomyces alanosinicus]
MSHTGHVGHAVSDFEAWLGAALRAGAVAGDGTGEAERRAVAAFRAARETRTSPARTRRRDDWRPAAPRRGRSLRATFSVAFASLALGGVAVAAIGSAGSGTDARPDTPRSARPSASTPYRPAAPGTSAGPATPSPSGRPHHPATARDTVAHCRTYERAGGRGGALDSTAWQRLVAAAGGADRVAAYCTTQVTNDTAGNGKTAGNGAKSSKSNTKSGPNGGDSKPRPKPVAGATKPATGNAKQSGGSAKAANGG